MKISGKKPTGTSTGTTGPITKENYRSRFQRHADGNWFVIRNPEGGESKFWAESAHTPAQWHAWMIWFGSKYISTNVAKKIGVMSVPTEWPEDIDPEFGASDREWRPAPVAPVSNERSEAVERGFARLHAQMGNLPGRRVMNNFQADADRLVAKESLVQRAQEWRKPLEASDALRRSLGLPPRETPVTPDMGDPDVQPY